MLKSKALSWICLKWTFCFSEAIYIIIFMITSVIFSGVPGELWQRHTQKERDRSTHLCSAGSNLALVVVRQNHFARRNTGMHWGGVTPLSPSLCPPFPVPLAYWRSCGTSERNCLTCKKKSISNGFFKISIELWWVTDFFLFLYNNLKLAPRFIFCLSASYWKCDLCLFILKICHPVWNELLLHNINKYEWGQRRVWSLRERGGVLSVVWSCFHGSCCTVSLFNKDVKSVCCASLDIINQLHLKTEMSEVSCTDNIVRHIKKYVFELITSPPLKPCIYPKRHWHCSHQSKQYYYSCVTCNRNCMVREL